MIDQGLCRIDKDTSGLLGGWRKQTLPMIIWLISLKIVKRNVFIKLFVTTPLVKIQAPLTPQLLETLITEPKMAVNPEGKQATTHFKVIKQSDKFSYLESTRDGKDTSN